MFVDGVVEFGSVHPFSVTHYAGIYAGKRQISVVWANKTALVSSQLTFAPSTNVLIAAIGKNGSSEYPLDLVLLEDTTRVPTAGETLIRFFHAAPGFPRAALWGSADYTGVAVVANATYDGSHIHAYESIVGGEETEFCVSYPVSGLPEGANGCGPLAYATYSVPVRNQSIYTAFFMGTPGSFTDPFKLVVSLDISFIPAPPPIPPAPPVPRPAGDSYVTVVNGLLTSAESEGVEVFVDGIQMNEKLLFGEWTGKKKVYIFNGWATAVYVSNAVTGERMLVTNETIFADASVAVTLMGDGSEMWPYRAHARSYRTTDPLPTQLTSCVFVTNAVVGLRFVDVYINDILTFANVAFNEATAYVCGDWEALANFTVYAAAVSPTSSLPLIGPAHVGGLENGNVYAISMIGQYCGCERGEKCVRKEGEGDAGAAGRVGDGGRDSVSASERGRGGAVWSERVSESERGVIGLERGVSERLLRRSSESEGRYTGEKSASERGYVGGEYVGGGFSPDGRPLTVNVRSRDNRDARERESAHTNTHDRDGRDVGVRRDGGSAAAAATATATHPSTLPCRVSLVAKELFSIAYSESSSDILQSSTALTPLHGNPTSTTTGGTQGENTPDHSTDLVTVVIIGVLASGLGATFLICVVLRARDSTGLDGVQHRGYDEIVDVPPSDVSYGDIGGNLRRADYYGAVYDGGRPMDITGIREDEYYPPRNLATSPMSIVASTVHGGSPDSENGGVHPAIAGRQPMSIQ